MRPCFHIASLGYGEVASQQRKGSKRRQGFSETAFEGAISQSRFTDHAGRRGPYSNSIVDNHAQSVTPAIGKYGVNQREVHGSFAQDTAAGLRNEVAPKKDAGQGDFEVFDNVQGRFSRLACCQYDANPLRLHALYCRHIALRDASLMVQKRSVAIDSHDFSLSCFVDQSSPQFRKLFYQFVRYCQAGIVIRGRCEFVITI